MDERLKFVARLLDGEKMAVLCREFGISRKTGYKIFERYKDMRPGGSDGSQPPALSARQSAAVPDRDADRAAEAGASRAGVRRRSASGWRGCIRMCTRPAISTVHAVLDRHGLVKRRKAAPQQGDGHAAVDGRPAQ